MSFLKRNFCQKDLPSRYLIEAATSVPVLSVPISAISVDISLRASPNVQSYSNMSNHIEATLVMYLFHPILEWDTVQASTPDEAAHTLVLSAVQV